MKKLFFLFIILSIDFALSAQTTAHNVAGIYERRLDATNGLIIYTLNLNADGTFLFHSYEKLDGGIPPERNKYAKGTWANDKKLVLFSTSPTDFDEKYILDFKNSKARFITKHPRDKSDREIKTALQFYESEIFWVEGMQVFKKQ